MPLTSEQRDAFSKRGFFSLGKPFAAAELDEIGAEYDRLLERARKIGEPGCTTFDYNALLQLQSPHRDTGGFFQVTGRPVRRSPVGRA